MSGGTAALGSTAITACFNATFATAQHVVLVGGFDEPLYLPATTAAPAQLRFTRDYAASALHEISHWCIAGPGRRRRRDFGYSYLPAPRTFTQQQAFLRSEAGAQALESLFADIAGVTFHLSLDDLEDRHPQLRQPFALAVAACRRRLEVDGTPPAARVFCEALRRRRQQPLVLS
ncbi:MAG: elongation factor P hydroxylase [Pseudomonadota bacterium]